MLCLELVLFVVLLLLRGVGGVFLSFVVLGVFLGEDSGWVVLFCFRTTKFFK